MLRARAAVDLLATLGLGAAVVATPLPINLAALVLWVFLVARWSKGLATTTGRRAGAVELAVHLVTMSVIVMAAASALVKVVDLVKARHITLPKPAMTLDELEEAGSFGMPTGLRYRISAPEGSAGRVVRFSSGEPTVAEFIEAIEAQTPLRHRFGHCGNGTTILWGGDCSFGLSFRVPPR